MAQKGGGGPDPLPLDPPLHIYCRHDVMYLLTHRPIHPSEPIKRFGHNITDAGVERRRGRGMGESSTLNARNRSKLYKVRSQAMSRGTRDGQRYKSIVNQHYWFYS